MSTTVVHPQDRTLQEALRLAALFATIKLLLHIAANLWQAHLGYGYYRDELYYIDCAKYMAWGYVDHGPLVALQTKLALALFGKSLAGIRMLSAVAGAGRVFLTGILAWSLGGRRPAQALAMIGVIVSLEYLIVDSYLSMNSVESIFWMSCLLALILILRGGSDKLWLLFGVSAGLGLLNKPSMTFFLLALLLALLLTPQRRLLMSRWAAAGVALMILIALPYLIWQFHYHWPLFEFLRNGQLAGKIQRRRPLAFFIFQVLGMHPISFLVWGTGLLWLLLAPSAKGWRWLGIVYVIFLPMMWRIHANDYYLTPIYPILFAAGGVAWERTFSRSARVIQNRVLAFPLMEALLALTGLVLMPWALPVLNPPTWVAYMKATHLYDLSVNRKAGISALPVFYADRFGWQEYADQVSRIYHSLSPEDQKRVAIFCSNYGETGAVNFLGHNLPTAISTHNNYFLWGTRGASGEVMIAVTPDTPEQLHKFYDSVQVVGKMDNSLAIRYERHNIYLLRGLKTSLPELWDEWKFYY